MKDIELVAAIRCVGSVGDIYRVYIDDDLITERSFIWDKNDNYILEHIFVLLAPGTHRIKVEPVPVKDYNSFRLMHLEFDRKLLEITNGVFHLSY
jgi:hypothetical protein